MIHRLRLAVGLVALVLVGSLGCSPEKPKSDVAKSESAKPEPAKAEAAEAKPEASKPEPSKAEPAKPAAAKPKAPTFTDIQAAGPDYAVQGEYAGKITDESGKETDYGLQVIALGDGKFTAVGFRGGLPGDGWDGEWRQQWDNAEKQDLPNSVRFDGDHFNATIVPKDDTHEVHVATPSGDNLGTMKRVVRTSPTMGAKPPEGAIVLFDGTSLDQFIGGQINQDKCLTPVLGQKTDDGKPKSGDMLTKEKFGDMTLHLEFCTPFMPTARGQGRGNSGVYLQNHYECQVLDSFGLTGEDNECGGFYQVKKPAVNMCYPPLVWQTYDIDFTAPKFDAEGKKSANAQISVKHNGVPIHENVEVPNTTKGSSPEPEAATGPIKLQDHGNPVQYRNIWIVKKS